MIIIEAAMHLFSDGLFLESCLQMLCFFSVSLISNAKMNEVSTNPIKQATNHEPTYPHIPPPLHAQVNASIGLPDLPRCKTMARPRPDLLFDRTDVTFKAEIKPGCRLPYAGFPSLFVLPVPGAALKPIKLNCFGSDSRYSTLVLSLPQQVCVSLICIFQKKILYCGSLHCISLLLSIFCDLNTKGLFHEPLLLFLVVYNTTFSSFMRFCCAAYLRFYFWFHSGPGSTAPGVARGGKTTRNFGVCQLADDARSQGNYNCWA